MAKVSLISKANHKLGTKPPGIVLLSELQPTLWVCISDLQLGFAIHQSNMVNLHVSLANGSIQPQDWTLRSLNSSKFPFTAMESSLCPLSEWFAFPFWLYAELGTAELHFPSKYVEKGKYSAHLTFHPI